MTDDIWDEATAATYDVTHAARFGDEEIEATVDFLSEYATDGTALEFAVGTGRIALPLSERGVDVHGIESSTAMADQLRRKDDDNRVAVTIGDMSTTRLDGEFGLVYLVFNTITNLLTQEAQVACFRNAAAHLDVGGHFVVEVGVPPLQRLPPGETLVPGIVSDGHLSVTEYDVVDQTMVSHHAWTVDGATTTFRSRHRYAFPAEYDLMAGLAGMTLANRWASWKRDPFTATSTSHVSVWRRTDP